MNKNKIAAAVMALLVTSGAAASSFPNGISLLARAAETEAEVEDVTSYHPDALPEAQEDDEELYPETILVDNTMEFTVHGDEAELTWTVFDLSGDVVIPDYVEGLPVTSIGQNAFAYNTKITSVVLPECLRKISEGSFLHCVNLKDIDIPESTIFFGVHAFTGTPWLEDMKELYSQTGLVTVNKIVIDGSQCSGDVEVYDGYRGIADGAFRGNDKIRKIYADNGVEFIGESAFEFCSNLDTAEIGWSISKIGFRAFYCCEKLRTVLLQNPECDIDESMDTICNIDEYGPVYNGVIASVPGYDTEQYAKDHGMQFTDLRSGAYQVIEENGIEYHYYGGYAVAAKVSGATESTVEISSFVKNAPVVAIGEKAFAGCEGITTILIPDCVKKIEREAFAECPDLEHLETKGAVEIGYKAFYGCPKLEEIVLSEDVEYIGDSAFELDTNLRSITLPDNVSYIGDHCFTDCHELTEVTLPANLKAIPVETFQRCFSLKDVTFGSANKVMGRIEERAFADCTALTAFDIPDSVFEIGDEAFARCVSLEAVTIPGKVYRIEDDTFNTCIGLKIVNVSDGVNQIGDRAFASCNALEELYLPGSLEEIGEASFKNCRNLLVICLPDGLRIIGKEAFAYCCLAEKIYIPDSVSIIREYAFDNLAELSEIVIPDSVEELGYSAFANCPGLKDIYIMNPDMCIGFSNTTICTTCDPAGFYSSTGYKNGIFAGTIHGYKDSTAEEYAEYFGYNFEDMGYVPQEQQYSEALLGYVISNGAATLECCDTEFFGRVVIPSEVCGVPVKYISRGAFSKCRNVTSISLPDTLVAIDDSAFEDASSLEWVNIPDSVKYIGKSAFRGCTSLTGIELPEGIVCIEEGTFASCDSLVDVTLPESVQSINNDAFCCCKNLQSLTIPNPFCFMVQDSDLVCNLYSGSETYFTGVIRGAVGSRAERYAQVAGYNFEIIDDKAEAGVAGDANLDNAVTLADSLAILQNVANSTKYPLPDRAADNADVYLRGDGITASDAVSIQKYDLHLINDLPESWQKGANPIR